MKIPCPTCGKEVKVDPAIAVVETPFGTTIGLGVAVTPPKCEEEECPFKSDPEEDEDQNGQEDPETPTPTGPIGYA